MSITRTLFRSCITAPRLSIAATRSYATGPHSTKKPMSQSIDETAREVGAQKETSPQNPSVISSAGAVGKQFNPDGNIGQIGEKIGGPFSKDGAIGSQFDAAKDGIAGQVEKAVDGPAQKK